MKARPASGDGCGEGSMAPENEAPANGPDTSEERPQAPARRRGGCLRGIFRTTRTTMLIVLVVLGAGWYWLENGSIGEFVADRISAALETGLGRDVAVGRVSIRPTIPPKIVVRDVRIANLPGASSPEFARVGRLEVTGIIRSIVERRIDLGTIRVHDVAVSIEKMPASAGGGFNIPSWTSQDDSATPEVDIRRILLENIGVEYVDRDAQMKVSLSGLTAAVRPGKKLESLSATIERGDVRFSAGQVKLPPLGIAGALRADTRGLTIESFAARNDVLEIGARGAVSFEKEGATEVAADVRADLARLRGPLGLPADITMDGRVVSAITVRAGDGVEVAGTFQSGSARYDVYKVDALEGHFAVGGRGIEVALDKARFAGGAAKVSLSIPSADEDNVFEVEHDGVRVEQLLGTWGIGSSGLMGHADGKLSYRWRGKDVLDGRGEGRAVIEVERDGTTKALYAVPVEGTASYRFEDRRLVFDPLTIETGATSATVRGGFALETLAASLVADVRARDIRELDRITADIARSLGEKDWALLGIAGDGTLHASLSGSLAKPVVDGRIVAKRFHWAGVDLGDADAGLRFDASSGKLTFRRARFTAEGGTLTLHDDIVLPPGGEPVFGLTMEAERYPAPRALAAIALDLPVRGTATGGLRVTGRPSRGTVLFESLELVDQGAQASIDGTIGWTPEKNGLELECRIGMRGFPLESAWAFAGTGTEPPVGGALTGTMSLAGKLEELRGHGSIALRGATVAGEPIESASAEFEFDRGSLHARRLVVRLAGGKLEGQGFYDIKQERFEYEISTPGIELSKLRGWPDLEATVDGTLVASSSGSGELTHPEISIDLRLDRAKLLGAEDTPGSPPPSIRARLTRSDFNLEARVGPFAQISGAGVIEAESGDVTGSFRAVLDAGAPLIANATSGIGLETGGRATLEIDVAGNAREPAGLSVTGRLTDVDVTAGPHTIRTERPATFSFRRGLLELGRFSLLFDDKPFVIDGMLSATEKQMAMTIDGTLSSDLLAWVAPDFRMRGDLKVAATLDGALDDPKFSGTVEMRGGELRIRDIPQPFKDIDLALVVADRRVKIDALSATVGAGRLVAGGTIDRDPSGNARLRVSAQGSDFSFRVTPDLTVGGDCDLVITGNPAEKLKVNGTVNLDKALFTKKIDINKALADVFFSRKVTVDSIAAPWKEAILLGIDVRLAPRAIAIRNNVANITGSGEVRVNGSLARPVVIGRVVFDEGGTFDLRDVEYRVARGSIDFQNPFRTDPYIDISAEGRYQNEYDVTVNLNGTLDRLEATVTSDPPVDDLSLLSLLGGSFAQGSVSGTDAFTDARNSLVDASVGGVLSSTVPFADSVRIEGLSSEKPKVTLDKAISRELRAIVTYTLDDKGEDVEIVEWRVSDNLVLQFTRDSTKESSFLINAIDLTFRRRFAGQW